MTSNPKPDRPLATGGTEDHGLSARKRRALARVVTRVEPPPAPTAEESEEADAVPQPKRPGRWTAAHTRRLHMAASGRGGRYLVAWLPLLTIVAAIQWCGRRLRRLLPVGWDD